MIIMNMKMIILKILDYSKENLGFNYILEEPTITLSEDNKYYDELNNKSILFIDFGKITSDLEFNVEVIQCLFGFF